MQNKEIRYVLYNYTISDDYSTVEAGRVSLMSNSGNTGFNQSPIVEHRDNYENRFYLFVSLFSVKNSKHRNI